jgi:hypothetical protein
MPFVTKTFCTDCEEEVQHMSSHDCSESPENVMKREAEDKAWTEEYDKNAAAWGAYCGQNNIGNIGIPSVRGYPDQIAHEGRCIIYAVSDAEEYKDYATPILTNPTYGEIFRLFEDSILIAGDDHHIYFEGIQQIKDTRQWPEITDLVIISDCDFTDDITVFEYCTGS